MGDLAAMEPRANPLGPLSWDAILFDLDGTLADTAALILASYRHTMRTHLGMERPDEEWLRWIGTPLRDQIRRFARSDGEAEAMLVTYIEYQRSVHDEMARAFPGVSDLFDALDASGVRRGLVTSKGRDVGVRTLGCCGLEKRFDAMVFADDVERGKPDPQAVLLALERLGSPTVERVLLVGDSPHDIEAGRRAGVRTAAVLWGPVSGSALRAARPDFLARRIEDLLRLCLGPATG